MDPDRAATMDDEIGGSTDLSQARFRCLILAAVLNSRRADR